MAQTVTLLLLLSGEPTRGERGLLESYARRHAVTLVAPAPTPGPAYPPYGADRVLALEGRIDEARTSASSLDEARALELLAAIERELLQHPELPQAAWLMAERHRLAASVRREQPDGTREAEELARRARVLEGARAPAFGEAEIGTLSDSAPVNVRFPELGPRDLLEVDGVTGSPSVSILPGEHQLRVLRNGELVWAGWPALGGTPEVRLGIRPVIACGSEDLAGVESGASTPRVPAGVLCSRFFVARRKGRALEVSECRGRACGAFVALAPIRAEARPFPTWATVALAGVAAVGVTSLVLWGAGAFDRDEPAEQQRFVYRGVMQPEQ
ncbi:MAG TPA: hypothetical protein VGK73_29810 [Polyangiaceae bacterium]